MARGLWKGAISFGLVNVPVELFSAEKRSSELDLTMLDKRDLAPVGYKRYNKSTGADVPWGEIVKGYEYQDGQYVVLSDEDFRRANIEASKTVDIQAFVDLNDIPPLFFETPYYLAPGKRGEKAYALLRDALKKAGKAGIATVVIRTRQYLAAVYPFENVIVVHVLRYHDELRDPADLGGAKPPAQKSQSKEIAMAEQLIGSMSMAFKPNEYTDTYRDDLLKLVKSRARTGGRKSPPLAKEADGAEPRVLDLMAALQQSVKARKRVTPGSKRPTKGPRAISRRSA